MTKSPPLLTTKAACRVARLDRDRFNEHVAAGQFRCAPDTIPGRARLFDPHSMIALWLFRDLMKDGFPAKKAGFIACSVSGFASRYPDEPLVSFFDFHTQDEHTFRDGVPGLPSTIPDASEWGDTQRNPLAIRKVTTFNIKSMRADIAEATEYEGSIIGADD